MTPTPEFIRATRSHYYDFVRKHPGKSATQIARSMKRKPASVSSALVKLANLGLVERKPDSGPRGGYTYYAVKYLQQEGKQIKDTRKTAWERILEDDLV